MAINVVASSKVVTVASLLVGKYTVDTEMAPKHSPVVFLKARSQVGNFALGLTGRACHVNEI